MLDVDKDQENVERAQAAEPADRYLVCRHHWLLDSYSAAAARQGRCAYCGVRAEFSAEGLFLLQILKA